MESLIFKVFDQKLGEFLLVDKENMKCDLPGGVVSLRNAQIKPDVFDQLHLPVTLRGGYIDEMSFTFDVGILGMFSTKGAKVVVKNCFFVFGPQTTDWSWQTVFDCKTKLVDLIMKIYTLKPVVNKKKKKKKTGGWFADLQQTMMENFIQKFLGLLEVQVSNIHFRYEDAVTQTTAPFACGFKIGSVQVASDAKQKDLRSTGKWNGSDQKLLAQLEQGILFFCQSIATRRISAYWDIGKHARITGPTAGKEVYEMFCQLNRRETFSACVVEKILSIFPPDHERRKRLPGPTFRERLDFHQYVVFPSGLSAHVTVNKTCETTRAQRAPLKDANVVVDHVEVAIDSEQVRSMNELLSYILDFLSKDRRFRTRPQEPISKYMVHLKSELPEHKAGLDELSHSKTGPDFSQGPFRSHSGIFGSHAVRVGLHAAHAPAPGNVIPATPEALAEAEARRELVRKWWQHAFHAVRLTCRIPKASLTAEELKQKCRLRENFVNLCIQERDMQESNGADTSSAVTGDSDALKSVTQRLRQMQMSLPLREIIDWRMLARQRQYDRDHAQDDEDNTIDEEEKKALEEMERRQKIPNTLQVRFHMRGCQAYYLIVVSNAWKDAIRKKLEDAREDPRRRSGDEASIQSRRGSAGDPCMAILKAFEKATTRQVVIMGEALDINVEAVQKGRAARVGRWVELRIGGVSVTNCVVKGESRGERHLLDINPFETRAGSPVCMYVGVNMLDQRDANTEPGDIHITSVLEPSLGATGHLREDAGEEAARKMEKLGFLQEHTDKEGKSMIFAFGRCGQVRALDYTPFRRRMMHFLSRGRPTAGTDLLRRPSPLALDRELLVTLQRRVQLLTGSSTSLSVLEGVIDGVRGRLVDHYNSQHVLCKEVSLAPLRCKALRNGSPQTFHMQFQQLLKSPDQQRQIGFPSLRSTDTFGLLPWKVGMLLLPKSDFAMVDAAYASLSAQAHAEEQATAKQPRALGTPGSVPDVPPGMVAEGDMFLKWGKNGKFQRRFVFFDQKNSAIIWKKSKSDTNPIGVIPLHSVQDISKGLETPVLQKARNHAKLQADRLLSVISTDRTLDLQADTAEQQLRWVQGLKEKFKEHLQSPHPEGDALATLPGNLHKRLKKYPEKYRSDKCDWRTTCRQVQDVAAYGGTLPACRASTGATLDAVGGADPRV